MHPDPTARARPIARSIAVATGLLAGLLVAGCSDATNGTGLPDAGGNPSASGGSAAAGNIGAQLCREVDPDLVKSVVGAAGAPAKPSEDANGWACRWDGEYISVGPNGAVDQPTVEVRLYRQSLGIRNGTAPPTPVTVAGRSATMTRAGPRFCQVVVQGGERTLTVSVATPVDRKDECPRAQTVAERLVPLVVR